MHRVSAVLSEEEYQELQTYASDRKITLSEAMRRSLKRLLRIERRMKRHPGSDLAIVIDDRIVVVLDLE